MQLLIVRHGRSQGDDEDRIEGAGWDAPLTGVGLEQAKLLAARLDSEGYHPHILFSSPLTRALTVAETVAGAVGVRPIIDHRLAEQHTGTVGGLSYSEASEVHPEPEDGYRSYLPFPGGESVFDLACRVMHFQAELMDRHLNQEVCIVAHGVTISLLLNVLYGLPLGSPWSQKHRYHFSTGDTGIHRLTVNGPGDVTTHFLNDTSHLKGTEFDR